MKIEGTQNIPSELFWPYKAALTEKGDNTFCKKRSPFRLPKMQAGGAGVTDRQRVWRERFKEIAGRFKALSQAEKSRWYNNVPVGLPFDYYYNFYVYSSYNFAILNIVELTGVIKSIQFAEDVVPTTGGKTFTITTVDPAKTVVVPLGNSYIKDKIHRGNGIVADGTETTLSIGATINTDIADISLVGSIIEGDLDAGSGQIVGQHAVVDALTTTQIVIKSPVTLGLGNIGFSWQITERKGRIVMPIVKQINAASVVIDWTEEPDAANRVCIQVVEYI